MDLVPYIDFTSSEILNANGKLSDIFGAAEGSAGVTSECDPQLLITLHFKEPIKIASIKFESPKAASAPRKVKLFVNKLNLGFSEAEDQPATQELTLAAKDTNSSANPLETSTKVLTAKFAKVSSLTMFIVDNQGDEEATALSRIVVFGASQSGAPPTNVKVINSPTEYNNYVKNSPGKTVIAYFHASWCTHCRTTSPLVAKVSMLTNDMIIMSVDVDKLKALPEAQNLQGVPHFKVYQDGQLIHDEAGIPDVLKNMVQKFEYDAADSLPAASRDPSGL
jgi:thiol-disulfide isomerase/thioredoxin